MPPVNIRLNSKKVVITLNWPAQAPTCCSCTSGSCCSRPGFCWSCHRWTSSSFCRTNSRGSLPTNPYPPSYSHPTPPNPTHPTSGVGTFWSNCCYFLRFRSWLAQWLPRANERQQGWWKYFPHQRILSGSNVCPKVWVEALPFRQLNISF